jgi:hypothetical protein
MVPPESITIELEVEDLEVAGPEPTARANPTVQFQLDEPRSKEERRVNEYLRLERSHGLDKLTPEQQLAVIRDLAKR